MKIKRLDCFISGYAVSAYSYCVKWLFPARHARIYTDGILIGMITDLFPFSVQA